MRDLRLQRYVKYFESLTPTAIENIGQYMTDDIHFSDPFNDVNGINATRLIFDKMFCDLEDVVFDVTHAAVAEEDDSFALLCWQLDATVKNSGKHLSISGMSRIYFAIDGRVREHIDHWDVSRQIYEQLPVLGPVLCWIRSRLAA